MLLQCVDRMINALNLEGTIHRNYIMFIKSKKIIHGSVFLIKGMMTRNIQAQSCHAVI